MVVPDEVALPAAKDVVAGKIVELVDLGTLDEPELEAAEAVGVVEVVVGDTLVVDEGKLGFGGVGPSATLLVDVGVGEVAMEDRDEDGLVGTSLLAVIVKMITVEVKLPPIGITATTLFGPPVGSAIVSVTVPRPT